MNKRSKIMVVLSVFLVTGLTGCSTFKISGYAKKEAIVTPSVNDEARNEVMRENKRGRSR